jgi:ABC-type sugar transport system permease subunit
MATTAVSARSSRSQSGFSRWWWRNQRKLSPYIFIAPFFVLFLIFGIYPILYSLWLSFFKGFGFDKKTFYGLGNYIHLFQDPRFADVIWNTTKYALGSIFIISPLALLAALAINSHWVRWKTLYKVAFFFPFITSEVIIGVIFARVFDAQFGLLNTMLGWFHIPPVGWLTDTNVVMPSIILVGVWAYLGVNMLFWLGGLNGINQDLYEAASIDGAGSWQRFWNVTWPLLRPVTLFIVIQAIIGSYNLFGIPLVLTNGGPGDASRTTSLYLYNQGFEYFNVGYASAIAYAMAIFLFLLSFLNIRLFGGYGASE